MDEVVAARVLRAVELVPRGRVVSYGDLAELVGGTPRQVGSVMRLCGSQVPWWRVVNASGDLPEHLADEARSLWAEEGITWKPNGLGCRIDRHRCDLAALADGFDRVLAEG